jgi:methylglutaconyl-CoA hydratase
MNNSAVIYSVATGVATLTLNRPESKNSLSAELMNALSDGLKCAIGDNAVRVIQLTNNGNTFCAGANLKDSNSDEAPRCSLVDIFNLMQQSPKPIVGRIAGHCTGGGVGLAAACDLSIAADDIIIGFTEVRIGVAPAIISVVCLPKMRYGDAMELFLSGERIPSIRAAEVGLLNHAVPRENLNAKVADILEKLSRGGPRALAAAKQLVVKVPDMNRDEAFTWTEKLSANLFLSEEAAAGIKAFRNREDPPWVPSK